MQLKESAAYELRQFAPSSSQLRAWLFDDSFWDELKILNNWRYDPSVNLARVNTLGTIGAKELPQLIGALNRQVNHLVLH